MMDDFVIEIFALLSLFATYSSIGGIYERTRIFTTIL